MGIRRGTWNAETYNKAAAIKAGRYGARPATVKKAGVSNSDYHMQARGVVISEANVPNSVSEHRKGDLIRATETGGMSNRALPMPQLVYSNSFKALEETRKKYGLQKSASIVSDTSRLGGTGGTVRQAPEVYSPLFQIANLQLPRQRITMNAWNRNFYDTHPLVHNCINLHATYPINKINIKCKDRQVEQFFNDMAERIDLIGILQAMALEFWKMGEVFPYAELDETEGTWKEIVIQNPDHIHIKTHVMTGESIISLMPDEALKKLVQSSSPADMQLRSQIDEEVVHYIKQGKFIPLDNFHVSHLAMKSAPYDIHGTSPIVTIYKDLMLYDKLRESKFAQADNLVNPITLVKVGGTAEGEYHPTSEDLEYYRQIMENAQYDKDFKIITHAGVTVERVGASGAIIDINNDMNFILDNILHGLMVPKAVITQEGSSFSSATVGLEVLKQRYESFRNMMSQWLVKKIFAPISEIQEFYSYDGGEKKLIVPDVEWNKMILFDMDQYINTLNQLVGNMTVSKTTLFRSLGLNMEEERRLIREEMIQQQIVAKEAAILQALPLGALRALKPDEDIIEPTEEPVPGTPGAEDSGMPGVPGGGLGGPPIGGLGPMPGGAGGGGGGLGPPPPGGGGLGPPAGPPPGGPPPGAGGPPPGPPLGGGEGGGPPAGL